MNTPKDQSKKKSILVVDDNQEILENMKSVLTEEGFRVVVSTDGHDALFKFTNERFDLVISDINMPKMNGLNFIKHLRNNENQHKITPPTPVIFISGSIDDNMKELQVMDRVSCLPKPFTGTELLEKVTPYFKVATNKNVVSAMKKTLKAGEVLIEENSTENEMYWIVTGKFEVVKKNPQGQFVKIGEIKQGELVGEMSFLTQTNRSATVKAMEDAEVVVIPNEKFVEVIDKQPRWFQTLLRTLAFRLKEANEKLIID